MIEVYKREHERVYGYYVLPLLRRDRLVGRATSSTTARPGRWSSGRFIPSRACAAISTTASTPGWCGCDGC